MKKIAYFILFISFAIILYSNLVGYSTGIVDLTQKGGNGLGCYCHGPVPDTLISVIIAGPSQVMINDTVLYQLRIRGGRNLAAGCDISSNLGTLNTSIEDTSLQIMVGNGIELTHRYPKMFKEDTLIFTFEYIAPPAANGTDTIFANGNSVNLSHTPSGDQWNFAVNFPVEIIDEPMPVELTSFTYSVNNTDVLLNWATSSEQNNYGFDVERFQMSSSSNHSWSRIGFVNGIGNSASTSDYVFTDENLSSGKYKYRLKQIDFNGSFKYYYLTGEAVIGAPSKFQLSQNYPNPFNPSTKISFGIPQQGFVKLTVSDAAGREVETLISSDMSEGFYNVDWNASKYSSGIYFYTIQSKGYSETKRMVLVK